ncbi:MAG: helix-hairpin-helix domain-containing protein [Candidatus Symbiothrix sp.]|jgi:hypothetical protein|nr:helix-hairpin-helix domain-containing protein [Candidatus Symbiothrix sp.]
MKQLPAILLLLFFPLQNAIAQSGPDNNLWMSYLEELAGTEDMEESYIENLYEELSSLSENPYNIQTVTKQDLEKLPFLSDIQIENLLYYIYRYGPVVDIYELKNVEDLDRQTIAYLLPFLYVGEPENLSGKPQQKQFRNRVKQDFAIGSNFTVQKKAGYEKVPEEERALHPNRYYLGNPYALSFRYNLNYGDKIQFSLTGEKDAGEIFRNERQKGFDFYSFNLTFKNAGYLKTFVAGNYRLAFGEGLVINNHFSMGKTSDAVNINQKNTEIKRTASTNENQYFSGIAGTLQFNRLETSFFLSSRRQDANADSSTIYTFKTDGYHRTPNEIEKKNSAEVDLFGTHLQWKNETLTFGLTASAYSFGDKELNPEPKPYNRYALRGKNHYNTGINYAYYKKKIIFHGETAIDKAGKVASIHNLSFIPASSASWVLSYRYYMKDYNALYSKAFSESANVQNETGLYTGVKFHLFPRWILTGYWDYFTFPWLRFGIDAPSRGNDILFHLSYRTNEKIQMAVRYRWKEKYKNQSTENEHEIKVLPYDQHQWRYQFNYRPVSSIFLRTQADYKLYRSATERQSGWSLTQNFSYAPADKTRFQLDGGVAYFHSPAWETRINIYEKSVLYAFNSSNYYGEGLRYYAVLKWKITNPLTIYFKAASTHYFDKAAISSGLEEIEGNEKSDVYILVKYKF